MERKLPFNPEYTEVGIIFKDPMQALSFAQDLFDTAEQQIPEQGECWPSKIYWDYTELHFYMDRYSWGTSPENFLEEFQQDDLELLEVKTWYTTRVDKEEPEDNVFIDIRNNREYLADILEAAFPNEFRNLDIQECVEHVDIQTPKIDAHPVDFYINIGYMRKALAPYEKDILSIYPFEGYHYKEIDAIRGPHTSQSSVLWRPILTTESFRILVPSELHGERAMNYLKENQL